MNHFTAALQTVLRRSFGDKIAAMAAAAGMHGPEVGRLLKDEAPLTAEKLFKLLSSEGMTENDKHLLTQGAVRDLVGEDAYRTWFIKPQQETNVQEKLGGPNFKALFPLSSRAQQVITYIIDHAHEKDVNSALDLLGRFLELPPPELVPPEALPPRREVKYQRPPRNS